MAKITKRLIDQSQPSNKDYFVWCDELKGFGVRVFTSGQKSFLIQYRDHQNRTRRFTIGRYGHLTPDQARTEAMRHLGSVRLGENPSEERRQKRADISIAELCDQYLEDVSSGRYLTRFNRPKKQSTIMTDIGRIETHIRPLLGNLSVSSIDRRTVEKFVIDIREGKTKRNIRSGKKRGRSIVGGGSGTARRTIGLLSGMMTYAREMGVIEGNPCHGIRCGVDEKRTRFFKPEEYAAIGKAMRELEAEGVNSVGINAIRLLALTGCRVGEVRVLKRRELDEHCGCFRLEDSKTGAQIRPIGSAAFQLLNSLEVSRTSQFIFPAARGDGAFDGLRKIWNQICERAKIEDAVMHTLRHSYASVAAELNYSDATIAAMLGHSLGTVTSRYTHFIDEVLMTTANRVSETIQFRLTVQKTICSEQHKQSQNI
ncbi:MAG: tyrosine-type recombinase/integrase [Salaquimonas sp.]